MRTEIPLLQYVKVAAPCSADWNEMAEVDGDRVKFCSGCQKRVYNLSAMGQAEAEGLLRKHEGHLCVRYYRRTDGTILTTDCPVGLKAARQLAFQRAKVSLAACVVFCLSFALHRANLAPREQGGITFRSDTIALEEDSIQAPAERLTPMMGAVAMPVEELKTQLNKVPTAPYRQGHRQSRQNTSTNSEKHE